jgi:molybdopterin synthase catalytic subunit
MSRWITEGPLDLNRLIQESEDHASGALVIFVGTVRDNHTGQPVSGMTYEAHVPLAEKALQQIEQEARQRFEIRSCLIQHRIGDLSLGEASVLIVVRAAHRDAAYQASRYAIEELKRRAPIWKYEHYLSGESRYLDGTPLERNENP